MNNFYSLISAAFSVITAAIVLFVVIAIGASAEVTLSVILSGSIVGVIMGILATSKGASSGWSAAFVFLGCVGAICNWIFALVILKITTISLFGSTAIIFGAFVGVVGGAALCQFFFETAIKKSTTN